MYKKGSIEMNLKQPDNVINLDRSLMLYQKYESILLNPDQKTIPAEYFKFLTAQQKQAQSLKIIRFAIENYLKWRPIDVKRYLTMSIMKKMKLDLLIKQYIPIPAEYKSKTDATFLAQMLYPKVYKENLEKQCRQMFDKICNGELARFPSRWIDGFNGIRRLSILIQYMVSTMPRFESLYEMYEYFANKKAGKIFQQYKLYNFAMSLYPSIFEAFHYSMPPDLQSETLYYMFQYKRHYRL